MVLNKGLLLPISYSGSIDFLKKLKPKSNGELVLAAVTQNGYEFEYGSDRLKNNEQVLLAAIMQRGQHCRIEYLRSREIIGYLHYFGIKYNTQTIINIKKSLLYKQKEIMMLDSPFFIQGGVVASTISRFLSFNDTLKVGKFLSKKSYWTGSA